ncbi:MAG: OmpH family outer membrane protein [Sedimentisphaerales bacterium]|nr:OmpH family outer membrane protein [Sedimentisphaerales bacterium]
MKIKTLISGCLVGMIVLFLVHQFGEAQPLANGPASTIGVVNIEKSLQNCQATAKFKERAEAERREMDAEEKKLSDNIDSLRGTLQALVPNSADWLAQYKEMLHKENELKALKELNPQIRAMRAHQWTERLYPEIMRITKELAAQKGLALVLTVEEPQLPTQRYEELVMTLRTHKVLYTGGCVDLTNEIIVELDKTNSLLVN